MIGNDVSERLLSVACGDDASSILAPREWSAIVFTSGYNAVTKGPQTGFQIVK